MKDRINTYMAVFFITAAGIAAAWLIVSVANSTAIAINGSAEQEEYKELEKSILEGN